MLSPFSALFFYYLPHTGGGNGVNEMAREKSLTLNERKALQGRWKRGDSAAQIARDIGVCSATIYTELKRGADGTLDENRRWRYDAELGQAAFQEALRNRGRRPTAAPD